MERVELTEPDFFVLTCLTYESMECVLEPDGPTIAGVMAPFEVDPCVPYVASFYGARTDMNLVFYSPDLA